MAEQTFTIAAIPADGVGKEVVAAGREILDYLAEHSGGRFSFSWEEFPWGCEYYEKTGEMMDPDGLEILKPFDAIYFGAVGWPTVPDHISAVGLAPERHPELRPVGQHPAGEVPARRRSPRCARPMTPNWTGSSSGRTAKANTPGWAGATSARAGRATRSRCRPRCSPTRAASASCASRSTWPAPAR